MYDGEILNKYNYIVEILQDSNYVPTINKTNIRTYYTLNKVFELLVNEENCKIIVKEDGKYITTNIILNKKISIVLSTTKIIKSNPNKTINNYYKDLKKELLEFISKDAIYTKLLSNKYRSKYLPLYYNISTNNIDTNKVWVKKKRDKQWYLFDKDEVPSNILLEKKAYYI